MCLTVKTVSGWFAVGLRSSSKHSGMEDPVDLDMYRFMHD